MAEVKLFGVWDSPFSKRVELALKLKGVKYEYIEEDLKNKSPLLLNYNPVHKKVPVLLHNGKPISESLIILEYIDDTWQQGPPILPKDPYLRSKARFWAKFVDDKCIPAMWKACWQKGEEGEKAMEEANDALEFLENEIKGKRFFGGDDSIGLVDIAADVIACRNGIIAELMGVQFLRKDKFPNLCKWADEYCNCSFVKENQPPNQKLIHHYKALIQASTSSKSTK
ncbi:hypothetical protein MIMGU_mgv1a013264mg [Erythranthe guttata]|uniref:glutathione transferase n=3 Tax=Erythranthe guttata TaxID=4155 RepID=A0A022QF93_ERYGU|nr:hypothetical protein MIMGU_mgv1a013264mg [Erythranthe guttata]